MMRTVPAPHMKNPHAIRSRPLLLLLCMLVAPAFIKAQQAGFTYTASPVSQCAPAVFTFRNTSTGTPLSCIWNFGNGNTSNDLNPVVTFPNAGPVTVTLTAYYPNSTSSATQNFVVYAMPVPDFSVNTAIACGPYTATFTDLTPGGVQRIWDFGDGTPTVTTNSSTVQHQFTRIDTFDITLTVSNTTGCTKTLKKQDFIKLAAPVINVSGTGLQGCVPFAATLSANVTTINNDPVASYAWVFGDSQSSNGTTPGITHTYNSAGNFNVSLAITTQQGCTATRNFPQLVKTGTAPSNVSFTATRPDNCAGTSARLLATATNASRYRWDFGDGTTYEGPENDINRVFRISGPVTIQMSAGSNGCFTAATPITLTNNGPVADFSFTRRCDNKNAYNFTNTSAGSAGDTYEWDFADNSPLDNTMHPVHAYTQPGTYNVRLTVRNTVQNCMSTIFKTIQVFTADFHTGVGTICRSSEVDYGVVHVPHTLVDSYNWKFGDGTGLTTTNVDIKKKMLVKGLFTDTLIIRYNDPAYCADTIVKKDHLNVIAPVAGFTLAATACEGQPVRFAESSVPSPNIPLTNWKWDLGNGTSSAIQVPAPTKYNASGLFPVKLVVTDARNCVDSITVNIPVRPTPFVHATTPQAKVCEGNSITLHALSNDPVAWQPAYQLSCTNCNDPIASPLKDTSYIAIATNVYGCSASDTVQLKVVPVVRLQVSPDTAICQGMSAQLRAAGAATYSWTPNTDAISGPATAMPVVTPTVNTTYTVVAGNDVACPSASAQITVQVKPVPVVNVGPDQVVTAGSLVNLSSTYSNDVIKWEWKPSTYLDCSTCPQTVSAIRQSMDYALEVTNNNGCKKTDVVNIKLVCDQGIVFFPTGFTPNGDGANDVFYPRGKGVQVIKSLRIFNRFGQEVFKRENFNVEDISQGWDGTLKGKVLPPDVYIYLFEAVCDTKEKFQLKGNVTLFR
ncbi:PKD domain-containing protein [Chitinophaga niabensis]|uniref:Gliding motility-associated C-terminal domain-containing protein n=1 Tax=Chitinophaga niabensis TaxID=536979 RepID=A0A1N6H8P2_9BACT|nr:PKD domain-containing protein [Chitinophaga niabensis]SIO16133.1 gliding motility-associated C-terminal domain-containing protein [Chitinophaga niabensis]